MPIRSDWRLQREGFTLDTIGRIAKYTILNPAATIPLLILARATQSGRDIAIQHPTALSQLRKLLGLGLLLHAGEFLSEAVTNNWCNDVYDWRREVVVVTGGSDGIGALMVQLLAERGVKVAVLDIQPLTYPAPPTVTFFRCDLASVDEIASTAASIRSAVGAPTVLINNAGITRGSKSVLESTPTDLQLTFGVNALAHWHLARTFLPAMIAADHGMVVTVASLAAYASAPNMVDYAASKAAALAFHEGLAAELASVHKAPRVRTVVCCPGYMRTSLFAGFEEGHAWVSYPLCPETVAEAVVKAVLSGRSKHIVLPKNAWYTAIPLRTLPVWMQYRARKRLHTLMQGWRGRKVEQPSENEAEASGEKADISEEKGEVDMEQSGVVV